MSDSLLLQLKYGLQLRLSRLFNRSFLAPIEALITLTNRCNLKCVMCSFHNYPMDLRDELSTKDIISMIKQLSDMHIGTLNFSGGEPLLREDLFEIIYHASSRRLNSILLTNGTIINPDIVRDINYSGLRSIWVSIDGLEKTHNYIRGAGSFAKSMNFIETVLERCPNVPLNIATTVMNCNLEDIPGLLKLWEKLKVKQVSFQPVIPDNTCWEVRKKDILWVPEQRLKLLDKTVDEIIDFKKNNDIVVNDPRFIDLIKYYFRNDLGKLKRKIHCYEGFKRFTITAGGRLWICGSEMKLSIKKHGLEKCWNAPEVRKKRKEMLGCKQSCLQACSFE